jgi:hypothetical protein
VQVHQLLGLYDEVEVPRDRLLFKVPATWQVCRGGIAANLRTVVNV